MDSNNRTKNIFAYQIYYDDQTKSLVDSEFIPLDNSRNDRSDWREYWPIRSVLKNVEFDDNDYVGFFSPKFTQKTGLTSAHVREFFETVTASTQIDIPDIISFSPYPDLCAIFVNIFEQGETNHSGITKLAIEVFEVLNIEINIQSMVNDSTTNIFSNFFIATPRFWNKWLDICEKIFDICEDKNSNLGQRLNQVVDHGMTIDAQAKVFIIERIATILLENRELYCVPYNPRKMPFELPKLIPYRDELFICDALKTSYRSTGDREYLNIYSKQRQKIAASLMKK
jgi:hypothetical protein